MQQKLSTLAGQLMKYFSYRPMSFFYQNLTVFRYKLRVEVEGRNTYGEVEISTIEK